MRTLAFANEPSLLNDLGVSKAAEMLGVTTKTLRNWDRLGKVIAIRHAVNGYRIYPRKQLEDLLSQSAEIQGEPSLDPT